jgi:hypothetical protein
MAKKLEDNGFWESSRMMLPQHKEQLLKQQTNDHKRARPVLDDQEQELLSKSIGDALTSKSIVTVTVFGDFEDRQLTGVITKVDPYERTIQIRCSSGLEVVPMADVLKVD